MTGTAPGPEFSRIVDVAALGAGEIVREIDATDDERAALARRLGLNAIASLAATVRVRQRGHRLVEVAGSFEADLEQTCVVTLEPVPAHIARSFRQLYSPDAEEPRGAVVIHPDEDEEDVLEPLVGERIDIGEAVVQQLAVALDPYPRKPGAQIPAEYAADGVDERRDGAFAALARLRRS
ncbi:MAG: DUF177 domain-containing protein [Rhodospirillaceae bacterium]|nr:DUF177 domain-containing protein [Rhodospirillaceae bacterium]